MYQNIPTTYTKFRVKYTFMVRNISVNVSIHSSN